MDLWAINKWQNDKCLKNKFFLAFLHTHEGNCEIIYVVSGTATFHYDDTVEEVRQGQVHYCPMNHAHYMENLTDHDLVYLAIVPEHH